MIEKATWMIRIQGYGAFEFNGTEAEAEEQRIHKARYERGFGTKWRKDLSRESDKISAEIADLADAGKGLPWKLMARLQRSLAKETAARNPDTPKGGA